MALIAAAGAGVLWAGALPAWWKALPRTSRMECTFVQESESAVFGKLRKEGTLKLAQGGKLHVAYTKGMLLIADGRNLVQYDPIAMTAQRMDLRSAAAEMPLLNILVDPGALDTSYEAKAEDEGKVLLEPRRRNLPKVMLEGKDGMLWRITWTDGTGAKQVLELKNPQIPKVDFPATTFVFRAPVGTRWIG